MTERLTKRVVDALQPGERDVLVWDPALPGFAVKVTPKGKKVYFFEGRIKGRPNKVRITIGQHGVDFTCDEARKRAEDTRQAFRDGKDPRASLKADEQADAERAARQISTIAENYFAAVVRAQAKGKEVESLLRREFLERWQDRDIRTITRADVIIVLDAIVADERPGAAREALKRVRPMFEWAWGRSLIEANPASRITLDSRYKPRERALTDAEVREVWAAADKVGQPFGPMVKLLLLTGQRLREVAHAPWSEFDLERSIWDIPAERTKNGKAHIVHLSPQAVKVLEAIPRIEKCQYILSTTGKTPVSGFSRAKENIDHEIANARAKAAEGAGAAPFAMPDWTFHDFRRTLATGCAQIGIAIHVIEKILNHNPAALKGVAGTYNRFEYLPERKTAIEAWGGYVEAVVSGRRKGANVVQLRA